MTPADKLKLDAEIQALTPGELRANLVTLDYKGRDYKSRCLERLIQLVTQTQQALYDDRLLQVCQKYDGESRHDTAKRYIREREADHNLSRCVEADMMAAVDDAVHEDPRRRWGPANIRVMSEAEACVVRPDFIFNKEADEKPQ